MFLITSDQLRRLLRLPALIAIEYKRHQDSLVDKSSYRNPTMVWRAPSRQVNPDKPHFNNSYNRSAHEGSGGAAPSTGFVKQPWKPRNTEDGATAGAGNAGGSYQPRPAWNKPGERAERTSSGGEYAGQGAIRGRSDSQEGNLSPKGAGGWQRGVSAATTAPAPASAPAAGMSSATAALQAAVGLKPVAKAAVAPPIPAATAPVGNAWARKGPTI